MFSKSIVCTFVFVVVGTGTVFAQNTAQTYLAPGRAALFDGTLSGIRDAAALFENGMNDAGCMDCRNDRELMFFYAISRMAMWAVRDDGEPVDSAIELAEAVGTEMEGDLIRYIEITTPDVPEDRYGRPVLPDDLEGLLAALATFRDETAVPELTSVIELLDGITETPIDPFKVFLTPSETQVFLDPEMPPYSYDIEVDYGDVLLLKGVLSMVKAQLTAQAAYDLNISEESQLLEKVFEDMFSIQNDLLLPHPDFLKLLPTGNDPGDGQAVLASARQSIIDGLGYYLEMLDYLLDESRTAGPGELDNELFAIESADTYLAENIREKVDALLGSLLEDTFLMVEGQSWKWFELTNGEDWLGLDVTVDLFGLFEGGDIEISGVDYYMYFWDVELEMIDGRLCGYAENGSYYNIALGTWWYIDGYFEGVLNEDHTMISDAFFDYWGGISGRIEALSGEAVWQETEPPLVVDVNPALGDSARYPDPVSPRDLLCEFGAWNKPVPGSVGAGPGGDPTLGGILPEATERDWIHWIDPQPTGNLLWPLVWPWQIAGEWPMFWLEEQLLFTDSLNDVAEGMDDIPGLDIHKLYMGFDWYNLYGAIVLKDAPGEGDTNYCMLSLSPSPNSHEALDALSIRIGYSNGDAFGDLYHRVDWGYGYSEWEYAGYVEVWLDENWLTFKMPIYSLPCSVSGRYLSIDSSRGYDFWDGEAADLNHTHLQIGQTGSVSGEVIFAGYRDGPIFVRAFTDLSEPEDSLVAYTLLDEPGAFTLEGMGLGLNCYVEAFCPLFGGYHPLDMDALKVSSIRPLSLKSETLSGVVLHLTAPPVLYNGLWEYGQTFPPLKREGFFAFDAIAGAVYTLELECMPDSYSYAHFTLLNRNGHDVLVKPYEWEMQQINWMCPVSGRYYVKVSEPEWSYEGGAYQIRMRTALDCPATDVSGGQWEGVKDCRVDMYDFALLAGYWMQGCEAPYWCEESDYSRSGEVDLSDLALLLDEWLTGLAVDQEIAHCQMAALAELYTYYSGSTVGSPSHQTWYVFIPGYSGEYMISLCGSDYDTWLDVYDECGGNRLAKNDDSCGSQSQLTLYLEGGEDYYIRIGGYDDATGYYELYIGE